MIRAEVTNPDDSKQKRAFTGELRFNPQPEKDSSVGYPIMMSGLPGGTWYSFAVVLVDTGYLPSLRLRLTDKGLEGEATTASQISTIRLQLEASTELGATPPSAEKEEEATRQKLIRATAPGTQYAGTITSVNQRQRTRLVFTEQNGFLIRADASNPDRPRESQHFTGELVFDPKPEEDSPDVAYTIVLSPVAQRTGSSDEEWHFYTDGGSLKLRLTDAGLEGEAKIGHNYRYTLRFLREFSSKTRSPAGHGYTVAVPDGWSIADTHPEGTDLMLISSADKTSTAYEAYLTVSVEKLAAGTTLDQYKENVKAALLKTSPGLIVLDGGNMPVSYLTGQYVTYSVQKQGIDTQGVCIVVISGATGAAMTFETRKALYPSYEKVFEAVAATFRFENLTGTKGAAPVTQSGSDKGTDPAADRDAKRRPVLIEREKAREERIRQK